MAQLLLVEDDAPIRGALIRALTERGHAVASRPSADDRAAARPGLPPRPGPARPRTARPRRLRGAADDARDQPRCRSWWSPRATTRPRSSGCSTPAPTTTWSSRSGRATSTPGSARCCAGRGDRRPGPAGPLVVGGLRLDPDAPRGHARRRPAGPEPARVRPAPLPGAARRRRSSTKRDLLTHVWRLPYGGADKTVDVHVSWLRRKLGETAQQPRYLHTVRGVGIKLSAAAMRLRVILLVVATSSLVLVSFLIPLALVLRTLAADRAVSTATDAGAVRWRRWSTTLPTGQPAADRSTRSTPETAPGSPSSCRRAPSSASPPPGRRRSSWPRKGTQLHRRSRPAGSRSWSPWQGLPGGTAVISTFVPGSVLRHGVTRAWLLLGCVGLLLLVLSVAVADQLARSVVRPIKALALASDRLAAGDLSARAAVAGPAGGAPGGRRAEPAGGAHQRTARARTGDRRRPVAPAAHPADRAAHRRRVAAGQRGDGAAAGRRRRGGAHRQRRSSARRGGRAATARGRRATRPRSSPNARRSGGRWPRTRTAG